ncbi:hypothetical protein [Petrachloros mirabilis]
MKVPRVPILLFSFLAVSAVLVDSAQAIGTTIAANSGMETKFEEAQDTLYALLLPNSMARTQPQTKQDVQHLLKRFERLASYFKKDPSTSLPFLVSKVKATPVDDQDPGLCALQLLYEINTEPARKVIQGAQQGANETLSEKATSMIQDHQGLLWGFRH